MADMTACGNVGRGPSMFYSFGVPTVEARTKFRDTLTPRAIMFNDALPESWTTAVGKVLRFQLDQPKAHTVMAQRIATALAKLSKGEVFLVVKNRNGDHGGVGAYKNPNPNDNLINVGRNYEFPAIQRNTKITKVTCVALTDNLQRHTDWEPNNSKYQMYPEVALLPDPNTKKRSVVDVRMPLATTLSTKTTTKSAASSTASTSAPKSTSKGTSTGSSTSTSTSASASASSSSCTSADAPANALLKSAFLAAGGKLPDDSKVSGPATASSSSTASSKAAASSASTTTTKAALSASTTTTKAALSADSTTTKATAPSSKASVSSASTTTAKTTTTTSTKKASTSKKVST